MTEYKKAETLGKMFSRTNPKFTRENRFNDVLRERTSEPAGKAEFIKDVLKPKKKRKAKKPVTWNYD